MKRILFVLICVIALTGCKEDTAKLVVENLTSYTLRMFTGTNSTGDFIGVVGPTRIETLTIDLGYTGRSDFVTAVAQDCSASTCAWSYNVSFKRGETREITVP